MKKLFLTFILCLSVAGKMIAAESVASGPATVGDKEWAQIETMCTSLLKPITPELENLFLKMEISAGDTFLGSGTLAIKKGTLSLFELFSKASECHYLNRKGESLCVLVNGGQSILFKAQGDAQVPAPHIFIVKDETEGFQLDFQMLMGTSTASQPVQFGVHPETGAYVSRRIRDKFPRVLETADSISFFGLAQATPSVILRRQGEKITGVTAFFPREKGSPIRLSIAPFQVGEPFADPDLKWIDREARCPWGNLDAVYSFTKGFYNLMSELMPHEGE